VEFIHLVLPTLKGGEHKCKLQMLDSAGSTPRGE
jgi:hypothetical protein